jgi:hypothetical protein
MDQIGVTSVLFVAGFGPIVHDTAASRKLYEQAFGISFKEETGGYLHTGDLKGAKEFALWPLSQAAQSCFGKDSWPNSLPTPQAWLEFDVEDVEKTTAELESRGYRMLGHAFHGSKWIGLLPFLLKVQSDIRVGLGTAYEHVAGSGPFQRLRVIANRSGNQTSHAGVTDSSPA